MYTNINLETVKDNAQYTDSVGTKYPGNYPKDEIGELFLVIENVKPEDTATDVVTDFSIQLINETYIQVWNTRLKTAEELQAEIDVEATKAQAGIDAFNASLDHEMLMADMQIIRALTEGDTTRINTHKLEQAARRELKK